MSDSVPYTAEPIPEPVPARRWLALDEPGRSLLLLALVLGFVPTLGGCSGKCEGLVYCVGGANQPGNPNSVASINVAVETTGDDIPRSGYVAHVGDVSMPVAALSGFVRFQNLPAGTYDVSLASVPANCSVAPPHPVSVTAAAGKVHDVSFDVFCTPDVGSVSVTTVTNGTVNDPDAYIVSVDTDSRPIALNGAVLFIDVPVGDHTVLLTSVAAPCFVVGGNPRTVSVAWHTGTPITFTVDCTGENGTLRVVTHTTGTHLDPDGYIVSAAGQNIVFDDDYTFDFTPLPAGDYEVTLQNVASNCAVGGENPRTETVTANTVTVTTFDVVCGAPPPMVLFESDRDGDLDIYRMNADGSGLVQLTHNDAPDDDEDASWSWDNRKIAFRSDRSGLSEIWVMDADGSNATQITSSVPDDHNPAFSPDGTRIVFDTGDDDAGTLQIVISDADGSNPVQLTAAPGIARNASFNPAGTRILFESDRDGDWDLYLMDPDGRNVVQLANIAGSDVEGSWSPDGTRIVFASQSGGTHHDLWLVNADGSGLTPLLVDAEDDRLPAFSPDGAQIFFTSDRDGSTDLFRIDADGTGLVKLPTNTAAIDEDAEVTKAGG